MLFDFHTHTFLSDGVLSPIELMRRAVANGYTAMAVTDHAGINDQERILDILVKDCAAKPMPDADRYLRIASRTPEENRALVEALAAVLSSAGARSGA